MRTIILLLFLGQFACDKPFRNSPETIEVAERDTVKVDTIFLNYWFGMSEAQFKAHTKELKKQKVIYNDRLTNLLTYDLTDDGGMTHQTVYSPEYFEGELSSLKLSVKSRSELFDSPAFLTSTMAILIMRKYGRIKEETESVIDRNCSYFLWEVGNLDVELFCGLDDARLTYTDSRYTAKQDSLKEKAAKKTIQDL